MRLGVVAQKEINHFFDDQVASFNGQHHLSEESRDVNAESHVGDDFFHDVTFAVAILFSAEGSEEGAELVHFSFA